MTNMQVNSIFGAPGWVLSEITPGYLTVTAQISTPEKVTNRHAVCHKVANEGMVNQPLGVKKTFCDLK